MKTVVKTILMALAVLAIASSCKKDQDPAKYSFIGCIIDGELYTNEGDDACLVNLSSKDKDGYHSVDSYSLLTGNSFFERPKYYCVSVDNHNPLHPRKYEIPVGIHWKGSNYVYGQEEIPLTTRSDYSHRETYGPPQNFAYICIDSFSEPVSGYIIIDSIEYEPLRIKARFEVEASDGEGNTISVKSGVIDGISVY